MKEGKTFETTIEDADEYLGAFEKRFKETLLEMITPEVPFSQTEDLDVCKYCPYISICHRG